MRRRRRVSKRRGVLFVIMLFSLTIAVSYLAAGDRQLPVPPASPSLEQADPPKRVHHNTDIIIRQRFTRCDHVEIWPGGDLPQELALINILGMSRDELESVLPVNWTLLEFTAGEVILESLDEQCRTCLEQKYIGIWGDRIAIFRGVPPGGSLEQVTEFEVREDVREQLERGIPYANMEELLLLLESYTS